LPLVDFLELLNKAVEEEAKEFARQQWLAYLPWMTKDNYISFDEFWKRLMVPQQLSWRSKEELLAEAEAIRRAVNDG
jgi:hypothetical protein